MKDALAGLAAGQAAIHLGQATDIAGDNGIRRRGLDIFDFVLQHRVADIRHLYAEQAAESAANFAFIELKQFSVAQIRDQFPRGSSQAQAAQTVTSIVHGERFFFGQLQLQVGDAQALYQELRGRLSVHVLCPNVVATNIVTSERNRPERFGGPRRTSAANPVLERFKAFGMPPSRCADLVFDAIRTGTFYIMAESEDDPGYVRLEAETRMKAILEDGLPYRPRSAYIASVFNPRTPMPPKR